MEIEINSFSGSVSKWTLQNSLPIIIPSSELPKFRISDQKLCRNTAVLKGNLNTFSSRLSACLIPISTTILAFKRQKLEKQLKTSVIRPH